MFTNCHCCQKFREIFNSRNFTHIFIFANVDSNVVIALKLLDSRASRANYAADVAAVDFDRHSDLHDNKKMFQVKKFFVILSLVIDMISATSIKLAKLHT